MCYQWIRNCLSFESTQVHSRLLYGFVLPNFQFSEQHFIGNCRFVLFHLAIVLSILLRLIAKFKTELRKRKDISQVPKHYEIGHRKLNIILTQVRCFASFLNYDLFQVNIVSEPSCRCGANREYSYHFFFDCSHYSNIRHTLFQNLNWLPNYCVLDLGNPTLSYEQNEIILKHVFEYIKRSER